MSILTFSLSGGGSRRGGGGGGWGPGEPKKGTKNERANGATGERVYVNKASVRGNRGGGGPRLS